MSAPRLADLGPVARAIFAAAIAADRAAKARKAATQTPQPEGVSTP